MAETYSTDVLLAVDFGTATTRVSLFDVVEGQYRFVAHGEAPSTIEPPYFNVTEGLRHALLELEAVTGRTLTNERGEPIIPSADDGSGVDVLLATTSGGPPLRTLLIGLLPDVSLETARRIAASAYAAILDSFSLGDRRREDQQFDAVLKANPDLILIAGGTDSGARDALLQFIETVALACHLLPTDTRTRVLYAGNAELQEKVSQLLGPVARVHLAANALPELGVEVLAPARAELAAIFNDLRLEQIGGLADISDMMDGALILPTAQAEAQTIRYLSQMLNVSGGVLGLNVGSASTSIAAAFNGDLCLEVRPDLGLGVSATGVLKDMPLSQFTRWLPFEMSESEVQDFIWNKSVRPRSVPAQTQDLHLEYALARNVIRASLRQARQRWPSAVQSARGDLLPWFDLIVAGGAVFGGAPHLTSAALVLLDALLPTAVCTLFLDPHHLGAALGAAARVNPMAVVQAVQKGAYLTLGMAISVVGSARVNQTVCEATLTTASGQTHTVAVKYGSFEVLPLSVGQKAKLTLKPRAGIDVGFGPGRGRTIPVLGGAVGIIIDARGRPVAFPRNDDKRRALIGDWFAKADGTL